MKSVLVKLRQELDTHRDPIRQKSSQLFFKEPIKSYGIKTPEVRKISKSYYNTTIKKLSKSEILSLCDELWESGYIEESLIACDWSASQYKNFEPEDFQIFKKWVDQNVNNWASCDTLCNHTMGRFISRFPEYLFQLKEFTKSENRWMRRAAAVSLIVPGKKGEFLEDILEIADLLLLDEDDLVQKGYGWLLKVSSHVHPNEVFAYIMQNKNRMPRTALRYAIEKLPPQMKMAAMAK